MRLSKISHIIIVLTAACYSIFAQCGPGCPACSGKPKGDLLEPKTIMGSVLYIPDSEEETVVLRARYGLFSWMDLGVGYGIDSEEGIWSVRVQALTQDDKWRPAVILGTGSVQTGINNQAGYIQLSKSVEILKDRISIALAGGYATDIPDLDENWGLCTISMTFIEKISPFYTYDGISSHVGLAYSFNDFLTLNGYILEMEEAAISVNLQWCFDK